jgi:CheY-like chemotaxis protein
MTTGTPAPAAAGWQCPPQVLVVDDIAIVASELAIGLSALGHAVAAVHSIEAALAALDGAPSVRVLVTDLHLGDGDGVFLAREAAARRQGRGPFSVVLITAHGRPEDIRLDLPDGWLELLHKPFRIRTLAEAVERMLADRR